MTEAVAIKPGEVALQRFRIERQGTWLTLSVECLDAPVWVMALTMEGFNAYKKRQIHSPAEGQVIKPRDIIDDPGGQDPPEGVLCASGPTYAFACGFGTMGHVGWWYLLIGNRGKDQITARYDVW